MKHRGYQGLEAWQQGMELAAEGYRVAARLPDKERFGLCDQIRRSAASIPANIAEGQSRERPREFARFLLIARGSVAELETHGLLCVRTGYFMDQEIEPLMALAGTTARLISGLLRHTRLVAGGGQRN
ncbi:MAG TPA: four helix bundle protein [Gemmatimonadaceae bacterium]|nr:four helix bundle protein [Gemmatimonadaceae bacterium]